VSHQEHRSRVDPGNGPVRGSEDSGSHRCRWGHTSTAGRKCDCQYRYRAALGPIPGLVEVQPLTHIEALELNEIPEHLIVVGGGYVGVELSQAMQRFGSTVTMIDRNARLMSKEDPDVCEALRSLLAEEGIYILLNARIKQASGKSGDSVSVVVEQNGIERVLKGSHVLVATGRNPNTEGLGLELAGVELTDRGYIKVNERLQTTASGV
jgi:pyruvate/2-oxoglutarate dehydrogenase complex dihydrolipoamide dehydrogenase (E3) component